MESDAKDEMLSTQNTYRDTLFAHAFVNQNPELFEALYPDIFGVDEDELDWETDPEEFEKFMQENFFG